MTTLPCYYTGKDLRKVTAAQLYDEFGLAADTRDFIGHAMALYTTDDYLNQPALEYVIIPPIFDA